MKDYLVMKTSDFDFELDESLIAQTPIKDRASSRLLVLDKKDGKIEHKIFKDIIDYLHPGDVMVLNDTKVIPARLYGKKVSTGANIEILILKEIDGLYECLVRPSRRVHIGDEISFKDGLLVIKCVQKFDEGIMRFSFSYQGILMEILDEIGSMPIPPYIHEELKEKDRYQTVYAKEFGSAAAPTAGLHFTTDLLEKIKEKGITICYVTLHIGLGTFRPVNVEDVKTHKMHTEQYHISKETADILNQAMKEKRRIISVGTTSTRTLESAYNEEYGFKETTSDTSIFIYPGYKFKVVDCLITNFHLPKSTLVMLVSALAGKENIMHAYQEAIKERYRFFSFGDAMFITEGI